MIKLDILAEELSKQTIKGINLFLLIAYIKIQKERDKLKKVIFKKEKRQLAKTTPVWTKMYRMRQ